MTPGSGLRPLIPVPVTTKLLKWSNRYLHHGDNDKRKHTESSFSGLYGKYGDGKQLFVGNFENHDVKSQKYRD